MSVFAYTALGGIPESRQPLGGDPTLRRRGMRDALGAAEEGIGGGGGMLPATCAVPFGTCTEAGGRRGAGGAGGGKGAGARIADDCRAWEKNAQMN